MKIRNAMMAMLILTVLGASSCATLTPPVVEHEEEITNGAVKSSAEKKAEERTWKDHEWDRGYSD